MAQGMNPAAPHYLPAFITAPGETDVFLVGAAIFLIVGVIALGSLYFRLHALPEHLAHGRASRLQFEVVAVLALLALFTHNSAFWVAALLLAIIPVPDLYAPLSGMAGSLAKMAARWGRDSAVTTAEADGREGITRSAGSTDAPMGAARQRAAAAQSSAQVIEPAEAGVTSVTEPQVRVERPPSDAQAGPRREET